MTLESWWIASKIGVSGFLVYRIHRFLRTHKTWELAFVFLALSILLGIGISNDESAKELNAWLNPVLVGLIILTAFERELAFLITQWVKKVGGSAATRKKEILGEIARAVTALAETKTGALIAFEQNNSLLKMGESGIQINSDVKKDLLIALFVKETPTHDGCVLIRNGRITHCGVVLPLTNQVSVDEGLRTRHRAAIGLSEKTDAVCLVVSEEEGTISIAKKGKLIRRIPPAELEKTLKQVLTFKEEKKYYPFHYLKQLTLKQYTHNTMRFSKSYGQYFYELVLVVFWLLVYVYWSPNGFPKSIQYIVDQPWIYLPSVQFLLSLFFVVQSREFALDGESGHGRKKTRVLFIPLYEKNFLMTHVKHVALKPKETKNSFWVLRLEEKTGKMIVVDEGTSFNSLLETANKIREFLRVELVY